MNNKELKTPNHREAFSLMWYVCQCGHKERIWNSRDGVTPFGFQCPSCRLGIANHYKFHEDIYSPDHVLGYNQKFWRDGTDEEADIYIAEIVTQINLRNHKPKLTEQEISDIYKKQKYDTGQFRKGWPMLDIYRGEKK